MTSAKVEKRKARDVSWKDPQVKHDYFKQFEGVRSQQDGQKPFEVFRAIERKDLIFLMQVRDNAFHVSVY